MLGKLTLTVAATAALALGLASEAQAGSISVDAGGYSINTGLDTSDGGAGRGGEFKVTAFDGDYSFSGAHLPEAGSLFQTFCLERDQSLGGATTWALNTVAISGGIGGQVPVGSNTDPLSSASAKLFYAFWADAWTDIGAISGVDYDYVNVATRQQNAADFQVALWALEDELTGQTLSTGAQNFVTFANNVTWADLGQGGWSGIGDVRVLNLFDSTGTIAKQDVLVVVPLPPAALGGLALLGAMGLIGTMRRRRRTA